MSVRTYLYDAPGRDQEVCLTSEILARMHEQQLLWIDMVDFDEQELRRVAAILDLNSSLVANLLDQERRPRLNNYGKHFQFNVETIQEAEGKYRPIELNFVVSAKFVLTAHSEPVDFLESFDQRIRADTSLGQLDAPSFLASLLDWHLTSYFRVVEQIEAEIDKMDAYALRPRRQHDLLADLSRMRHRIAFVRRRLTPHREVYAGLSRPDFQLFSNQEGGGRHSEHYRLLNGRLERAIESAENARELLIGSFEILTTQTALRTDEAMKAFTLASFIWFPAGVIVGIAGLLLHTPVNPGKSLGFWLTLASIPLIGLITLLVARRRQWL